MKTITICPACSTAFRVDRAQLEARDGKVRCGACRTVFDARASLHIIDDDSKVAVAPPPAKPKPPVESGPATIPAAPKAAEAPRPSRPKARAK